MNILITTLQYLGFIVLFFLLGWAVETGRNMATKTKKVCDICFRDISQVNEQYKHLIQHKEESNEK